MERNWADLEPDEKEFLERLPALAEGGSARNSNCPNPDLVLAAHSEVLREPAQTAITGHLASCPWCQALVRDFSDPAISEPTRQEAKRIRARVFRAAGLRPASPWSWWWRPLPVAATAALALAFGAWMFLGRQSPPPAPAVVSLPSILQLEKPAVKLPLTSALIWRSEAPAEEEKYLAELGSALAPYRADDFAEAARRLESLSRAHPQRAEVHLYLGVSQLFLSRPGEAVKSLQQARQLAEGPLAQESAWYLSLAWLRTGNRAAAAAELEALCREEGEHRARACAGREELRR